MKSFEKKSVKSNRKRKCRSSPFRCNPLIDIPIACKQIKSRSSAKLTRKNSTKSSFEDINGLNAVRLAHSFHLNQENSVASKDDTHIKTEHTNENGCKKIRKRKLTCKSNFKKCPSNLSEGSRSSVDFLMNRIDDFMKKKQDLDILKNNPPVFNQSENESVNLPIDLCPLPKQSNLSKKVDVCGKNKRNSRTYLDKTSKGCLKRNVSSKSMKPNRKSNQMKLRSNRKRSLYNHSNVSSKGYTKKKVCRNRNKSKSIKQCRTKSKVSKRIQRKSICRSGKSKWISKFRTKTKNRRSKSKSRTHSIRSSNKIASCSRNNKLSRKIKPKLKKRAKKRIASKCVKAYKNSALTSESCFANNPCDLTPNLPSTQVNNPCDSTPNQPSTQVTFNNTSPVISSHSKISSSINSSASRKNSRANSKRSDNCIIDDDLSRAVTDCLKYIDDRKEKAEKKTDGCVDSPKQFTINILTGSEDPRVECETTSSSKLNSRKRDSTSNNQYASQVYNRKSSNSDEYLHHHLLRKRSHRQSRKDTLKNDISQTYELDKYSDNYSPFEQQVSTVNYPQQQHQQQILPSPPTYFPQQQDKNRIYSNFQSKNHVNTKVSDQLQTQNQNQYAPQTLSPFSNSRINSEISSSINAYNHSPSSKLTNMNQTSQSSQFQPKQSFQSQPKMQQSITSSYNRYNINMPSKVNDIPSSQYLQDGSHNYFQNKPQSQPNSMACFNQCISSPTSIVQSLPTSQPQQYQQYQYSKNSFPNQSESQSNSQASFNQFISPSIVQTVASSVPTPQYQQPQYSQQNFQPQIGLSQTLSPINSSNKQSFGLPPSQSTGNQQQQISNPFSNYSNQQVSSPSDNNHHPQSLIGSQINSLVSPICPVLSKSQPFSDTNRPRKRRRNSKKHCGKSSKSYHSTKLENGTKRRKVRRNPVINGANIICNDKTGSCSGSRFRTKRRKIHRKPVINGANIICNDKTGRCGDDELGQGGSTFGGQACYGDYGCGGSCNKVGLRKRIHGEREPIQRDAVTCQVNCHSKSDDYSKKRLKSKPFDMLHRGKVKKSRIQSIGTNRVDRNDTQNSGFKSSITNSITSTKRNSLTTENMPSKTLKQSDIIREQIRRADIRIKNNKSSNQGEIYARNEKSSQISNKKRDMSSVVPSKQQSSKLESVELDNLTTRANSYKSASVGIEKRLSGHESSREDGGSLKSEGNVQAVTYESLKKASKELIEGVVDYSLPQN